MQGQNHHAVYLLSDRNMRTDENLSFEIASRGYYVIGRGLDNSSNNANQFFRSLSLDRQIDVICRDLLNYCWSEGSLIVAQSFGAYLMLNAIGRLGRIPSNILLVSPNSFNSTTHELASQPSRLTEVISMIERQYNRSIRLTMVTRSNDSTETLAMCKSVTHSTGGTYKFINHQTSDFSSKFGSEILDSWLPQIRTGIR